VKKQKYSRKDEKVHTWNLNHLSHPPSSKKLPFYPLSHLAVFKSLKHRPKPIHFPHFLYYSPNYFYQPWSLNTHRRVKNIIVALEWCPDRRQVRVSKEDADWGLAAPHVPNQPDKIGKSMDMEQEAKLKKAFNLFDTDKNGELDKIELREVMRALEAVNVNDNEDMEPVLAHVLANCSSNQSTITYEELKRMIMTGGHTRLQTGRFYVVVSLQEAESLRGWIHLARHSRSMLLSGMETTIGLRVGSYLLDGSSKYVPAYPFQQDTAEACLRFADSDIFYNARHLDLMLRSLQPNTLEARREWFDDMRACKRRQQTAWERTSLQRNFTMHSEFDLLEHKALVSRVRTLIRLKGMLMMDAFRAFDQDRNGRLNCSELYAAAHWLGLELQPQDVYDIMRKYDSTHSGTLHYQDFSATFKDPDEHTDIYEVAHSLLNPVAAEESSGMDVSNIVIPPMPIQELYDMNKKKKPGFKNKVIPPELLKALKVKLKPVPSWEKVWTSEGTNSRHQVSVWEVNKETTMWERSNKMRVSLGHYAVGGFQDPNRAKDKKHEPLTLEFTDTSVLSISHSEVLEMAVDQLVPHPSRYVQVWHQELGSHPFYAWKPIPPSIDHVALGYVGTNTPDEPPPEAVRCVPKAWVIPTKYEARLIWTDAGAGGKKGSVWAINSLQLMGVTPGHEKPTGAFFELWSKRFMASEAPTQPNPAVMMLTADPRLELPPSAQRAHNASLAAGIPTDIYRPAGGSFTSTSSSSGSGSGSYGSSSSSSGSSGSNVPASVPPPIHRHAARPSVSRAPNVSVTSPVSGGASSSPYLSPSPTPPPPPIPPLGTRKPPPPPPPPGSGSNPSLI